MVVVVGLTVMEPSTATEDPLIVQLVALVVVQLRVELLPSSIVDGLALKLSIVGGGVTAFTVTVTFWLTLPPEPVAVNV